MDTSDALPLVQELAALLVGRSARMVTAESCTGGLIAAACTELAGSSAWFERGFVTYSNEAKSELLGVDPQWIATHGAVSEPVARAMATGALQQADASFAVAVTGVAGPGGGTPDKPVGTVWVAWAGADGRVVSTLYRFNGGRAEVRRQTCLAALRGLISHVVQADPPFVLPRA